MRHCTVANTVLSGQVLDSSIVAIWMTTAANTHFCKISEDVDGRSEAIIEVFLWRTLIGIALVTLMRTCTRSMWLSDLP